MWIDPPHPKIGVCICAERNWFFWFNSDARFHGHGQLAVAKSEHEEALTKDCTLNLAEVCAASPQELSTAEDKGAVPAALMAKVIATLEQPIPTLSDINRKLALKNLLAASTPSTGATQDEPSQG